MAPLQRVTLTACRGMGRHAYVRARLAARTAMATLLAMVLGTAPVTGRLLRVNFLVPVLAILATQRTLGQTIRSSFLLVKGALIGVALTLVPVLVLPRHPAALFSLLVLCSGAVATFTKVPPVTKLALAIVVLECVVSLDVRVSSAELAAQLVLAVSCGCVCAVGALLLPRPHTARAAILTEASNAFEACGFALPHLATAFSTDTVAVARVALGRARHTLRSALDGCRRAENLVPFLAWENYPGAAPSGTYLAVLCQALLALLRRCAARPPRCGCGSAPRRCPDCLRQPRRDVHLPGPAGALPLTGRVRRPYGLQCGRGVQPSLVPDAELRGGGEAGA